MNEEDHTNQKEFLDVGDGHSLYFEDKGNPDAKPIFHLHGGPGAGFGDRTHQLYDLQKQRVIFHDQRGAKRSTPFAETEKNTTQDLIEDIEKLRTHLGIEKMHIVGGSWGSTLSLLYAIAHPERVERLLIWSVFLARQFEVDFVNNGPPQYFFPEAWEEFISRVPQEHRTDGNSIMQYYADQIHSTDDKQARDYANAWALWEGTLLSVEYDEEELRKEVLEDENTVAIAKIETHYFLNDCFIPENYILDNIGRIQNIPCSVIHGRFDMCTPPVSALDLKRAYGEHLSLTWVNSGHYSTDPEMLAALRGTIQEKLV